MNIRSRLALLLVLSCFTLAIGLWEAWPIEGFRSDIGDGQPRLPTVRLEGAPGGTLTVEVADEVHERKEGLSRRNTLKSGHGMVFLFPEPGTYGFWMNEMRFPIDIVYLREGVVTQVFPRVSAPLPGGVPTSVDPEKPADAVLELYAGEAGQRGIKEGTYFQGFPTLR